MFSPQGDFFFFSFYCSFMKGWMLTKPIVEINNFKISVKQTIMLYAFNLYSDLCQLFLNKTGRKISTTLPLPPPSSPQPWVTASRGLHCFLCILVFSACICPPIHFKEDVALLKHLSWVCWRLTARALRLRASFSHLLCLVEIWQQQWRGHQRFIVTEQRENANQRGYLDMPAMSFKEPA